MNNPTRHNLLPCGAYSVATRLTPRPARPLLVHPLRCQPMSLSESSAPAPAHRRDTWAAIGMVALLVAVMGGVAHAHLTGSHTPAGGLYLAMVAYAVATLWLVARVFSRRPG